MVTIKMTANIYHEMFGIRSQSPYETIPSNGHIARRDQL
jgi:hypothetical protein